MTRPLGARILAVLAAALAAASLVSAAYGPRPVTTYQGAVDAGGAAGVALLFFSISSNGALHLEIEGARQAFYVSNLTGDPLTVLRALSVFNIRMGESEMTHDVRAGLIRGYATIEAEQAILQALPAISRLLHFNIEEAPVSEGRIVIDTQLRAATGVVVVVVPESGTVIYTAEYRLEGYQRLSPGGAALVSGALLAASFAIDFYTRRTRTQEAFEGFLPRKHPTNSYVKNNPQYY